MTSLLSLTTTQLKRAIGIKDKIAKLEGQLASILGSTSNSAPQKQTRRPMSAASRAKIAAAQKARWAKAKGKSSAKAPAKKRTMSVAAKAKIGAAAKARWAKIKAAG